ncbi:MAG: sugar kinase [Phycisphaeraceae bacterium]|nr:sugar kinase [Phycisphaeraceae bacterium]
MPLIVTGSIGIDSVHAPTGTATDVLGGSSIYFAAAASFFGPVRLVGAVGEDFPDHFLETFNHFAVDLEGLERRAGSKTFRWTGRYHENMNERDTLEVHLNVLAEALPPIPEAYRDSQYIFLANTDPGSQAQLLDSFPDRRLAVADTMDLWIDTQKSQLLALLERIDGLVLNDAEAIMLTGATNLVQAAEVIVAMGPRFVVIKKGEHGSLLVHEDGHLALPAFPVRNVVDPTGAGDSFAGGMMGYLAAADDISIRTLRTAMAYGTIIASFNIESFSLDRMKQITRDDLDRRFEGFRAMLEL